MKIISFSINLEHVGDIIDKNLTEPAGKKIKRKFQFSAEGAREPAASHERIVKNSNIALAVWMSGDVQAARRLISEKAQAAQRRACRPRAASGAPACRAPGDLGDDLTSPIHSHIARWLLWSSMPPGRTKPGSRQHLEQSEPSAQAQ